jgi:hypothetical protein
LNGGLWLSSCPGSLAIATATQVAAEGNVTRIITVPPLLDAGGVRLTVEQYRREFPERRWLCDGRGSWKLERAQEFTEIGFASWEAFAAGDWDTAMGLYEELRGGLSKDADECERHRSPFCRARVVEEPLTPYMLWELHCFRIRVERSETIRMVRVAQVEALDPLPELVALCDQTLYRVMYDDRGVPDGAIRYTDPEVVRAGVELIRCLYDQGEDFQPYFSRVVAPLPVPRAPSPSPSLRGR